MQTPISGSPPKNGDNSNLRFGESGRPNSSATSNREESRPAGGTDSSRYNEDPRQGIEIEGGKRAAFEFLRRLAIARNAVSLGGIETLACHPKTTTHSELSDEELDRAEITDGLVRISIGTEHEKDLIADFEAALE